MVAGVVFWMRLASASNRPTGAFLQRDALVDVRHQSRSLLVSSISGKLTDVDALADTIEVWSADRVLLQSLRPSRSRTFAGRFKPTQSSDIAVVVKSRGKLLEAIPGPLIEDFSNVSLGRSKQVTFSTRFVNRLLDPQHVRLGGEFRVGAVTVPLDSERDLEVSPMGELGISGLPANGFVSLQILNRDYARTVALTDIALRDNPVRTFPNVKVHLANEIRGRVVNAKGLPVVNVKVTLSSNIRRLNVKPTKSDGEGKFSFTRLPNGIYSIQAVSYSDGDMCAHPESGIVCLDGTRVNLSPMQYNKGNFINFQVDSQSENRTQPVVLEVIGIHAGRSWVMTRMLPCNQTSRILIPSGMVKFKATQQPVNGILPSFRNLAISPSELLVKPLTSQTVNVKVLPRHR